MFKGLPRKMTRMMVVVFATLVAVLFLAPTFSREAHALSDRDYKELLLYPPFRQADEELAAVWKDASRDFRANGDGEFFLQQQREWIRSVRDEEARAFMNAGVSKEDAYTRAVRRRINQLLIHQANARLAPDELGAARDPDFYNQDELELPMDDGAPPNPRAGLLSTSDEFDALNVVNLARSLKTSVAFPVTTRQFASWIVWSGNTCLWKFGNSTGRAVLDCDMYTNTASGREAVNMQFCFLPDYDAGQCFLENVSSNGVTWPDELKDQAIVELVQMMVRDKARVPGDIFVDAQIVD